MWARHPGAQASGRGLLSWSSSLAATHIQCQSRKHSLPGPVQSSVCQRWPGGNWDRKASSFTYPRAHQCSRRTLSRAPSVVLLQVSVTSDRPVSGCFMRPKFTLSALEARNQISRTELKPEWPQAPDPSEEQEQNLSPATSRCRWPLVSLGCGHISAVCASMGHRAASSLHPERPLLVSAKDA